MSTPHHVQMTGRSKAQREPHWDDLVTKAAREFSISIEELFALAFADAGLERTHSLGPLERYRNPAENGGKRIIPKEVRAFCKKKHRCANSECNKRLVKLRFTRTTGSTTHHFCSPECMGINSEALRPPQPAKKPAPRPNAPREAGKRWTSSRAEMRAEREERERQTSEQKRTRPKRNTRAATPPDVKQAQKNAPKSSSEQPMPEQTNEKPPVVHQEKAGEAGETVEAESRDRIPPKKKDLWGPEQWDFRRWPTKDCAD